MEEEIIPEIQAGAANKRGNIPAADVDFATVVKSVSAKWTANPWLTLQWLSSTQFAADSTAFEIVLDDRQQTGSSRPQTTKTLELLDEKMEGALFYVKGYLLEKYGKGMAKSYYASFGIIHKNDSYIFPKDQNSRSASLELMVNSIAANGLGGKEYGTAFWTDIKTKYDAFLGMASSTDGQVSVKVGDKNALKKSLKKGLNAIVLSIRSNYPDNYKQELRNWGFQKEKY